MPNSLFSFQSEDIEFDLNHQNEIAAWITECIKNENLNTGEIAFIFTSDAFLLEMNQKYLDHDTYTDVIGFDYSEDDTISGDVFISVERVRENALEYGVKEPDELHRVMIHGILHFCGYSDNTEDARAQMQKKEDYCLSLRTF